MTRNVRLTLVQMRDAGSANSCCDAAVRWIEQAVEQGAEIICLQELFTGPYPCQAEDHRMFDLEPKALYILAFAIIPQLDLLGKNYWKSPVSFRMKCCNSSKPVSEWHKFPKPKYRGTLHTDQLPLDLQSRV